MIEIYVEFRISPNGKKYQRLIINDDGYPVYASFLDKAQLCKLLDLSPREAEDLIKRSADKDRSPIV